MLCMAEVHKEICHAEYDVHLASDSAKCRIELEQPNPTEVLKSKGFDAFLFWIKFIDINVKKSGECKQFHITDKAGLLFNAKDSKLVKFIS